MKKNDIEEDDEEEEEEEEDDEEEEEEEEEERRRRRCLLFCYLSTLYFICVFMYQVVLFPTFMPSWLPDTGVCQQSRDEGWRG